MYTVSVCNVHPHSSNEFFRNAKIDIERKTTPKIKNICSSSEYRGKRYKLVDSAVYSSKSPDPA